MTEEQTQVKISEILRTTSANTSNLFNQIADHIDALEAEVDQLKTRIQELESQNGTTNNTN